MKIVKIAASNFMKLIDVNLSLQDKGLIQVTGRNGAGKSTLLKLIEWLLQGNHSIQRKSKKAVVRNGADKASGRLELSDPIIGNYTVSRSLTSNGTQNLDVFDGQGKRVPDQQGWLNKLFTGLTFDPLAFAQMDTEEQVAELKRLAKVDLDYEAMAQADLEDAEERRTLKKEKTYLDKQIDQMKQDNERTGLLFENLPKKKIDETKIFAKLDQANRTNAEAQTLTSAKAAKLIHVEGLRRDQERKVDEIEAVRQQIEKLKQEVEARYQRLTELAGRIEEAEADFQAAPEGRMVDVAAISEELRNAQNTNRAIDLRGEWDRLLANIEDKKDRIHGLDERIDERERMRAQAIADAKLPVENLWFDANQVYFGKLPLANLGEGEQIRISTLLGMHMNPTLCCMCIQHGEALDDDGLRIIEQLAIEHDFQILMARVETSGEVGIVIENGRVATDNYRSKDAK